MRLILKFMILVFPALSLTAVSQVIFTAPITGSTVTDQVRVMGTAAPTTAGHWISKLTIYVDGRSAYNTSSGNFSALLKVSTGKHTILVKAWDNKGIGCQAATYITASGSGNGFYVASPMMGTSVNSSVRFSVNATSVTSHALASTTLYVDKVAIYTTHSSLLDTSASLTGGKRSILIESVDTAGAKNDLNFTLNVNASSPPPPPPPPPSLQITTGATLPDDAAGVSYSQTLAASGGSGTKAWSVTSGSLPAGLSLQSSGTISGAASSTPGQYSFTAQVADVSGTASKQFSMNVAGGVVSGAIAITDCNTPLTISNQLYQLANDISSAGTCLSVQGHDITIDLNGHTITYATAPTNPSGEHRHGIVAIACWDSDVQGNPCSDSSNFANITIAGNLGNPLAKGKIVQGIAAAAYSHAIRVGQGSIVKGLTVQGVDITIQSPSSIAIASNFSTGGAAIYNNAIHNNVTTILSRQELEGQSIKLDNESHATVGNMIHDNVIIGGAQGGIRETNQAGSKLYNNDISLNASYTNDFCIDAIGVGMEIYGNNCHNTQGRGFHLAGDKINVHDNTINVVEHSNSLEYGGKITSINRAGNVIMVNTWSDLYRSVGDTMWISGTAGLDGAYHVASVLSPHSYTINSVGTSVSLGSGGVASSCEVGGAYGIQVESDLMPTGTITINHNTVTANAGECPGSALRLTTVASSSTLNIHDNVFTANRIGATTQPAAGVSVDDVDLAGTTISNNAFAVDSSLLRAEYDGARNVTIKNGIVTTGANPSSAWLLADFQNYSGGSPAQNLIILDPTFQGAANDQNIHIVQTSVPQELYENWTMALKLVDQANAPVSGASVTIRDRSNATVYSGTSDANGMVQTVVTQKHWLNSGSVATTPHTVTVSDSNCSAGTGSFGITVNPSSLAMPGTPFVHSMGTCQ